jgi:hypothetical protein
VRKRGDHGVEKSAGGRRIVDGFLKRNEVVVMDWKKSANSSSSACCDRGERVWKK